MAACWAASGFVVVVGGTVVVVVGTVEVGGTVVVVGGTVVVGGAMTGGEVVAGGCGSPLRPRCDQSLKVRRLRHRGARKSTATPAMIGSGFLGEP